MSLPIATFSNTTGPSVFFKAIGHPLVCDRVAELLAGAARAGPVAVVDPSGHAGDLYALYPRPDPNCAGYYVQRIEDLDRALLGQAARPLSVLGEAAAATVLVAAFDAERTVETIRHLVPRGAELITLDRVRLPDAMLSNRARYLDPLNFATNFALFRDDGALTTRLVTANYWAGYGARDAALWFRLFDASGRPLATWEQPLSDAPELVTVSASEVRRRFRLPPFEGSLFIHAVRIAGHDSVKYTLDFDHADGSMLSSTHDANAFPADLYAGVPAPGEGERVVVWVQNSHPTPIPAGSIGLSPMGGGEVGWNAEVAPFGTLALDVGTVLPEVRWPRQIEVHGGRHLVRPRYEVMRAATRFVGHANVERTDLEPDRGLEAAAPLLGKGHLLVAPVLPLSSWRGLILPTPMTTRQSALALLVTIRDASGTVIARHATGTVARDRIEPIEVDGILAAAGARPDTEYGHLEIAYDPAARAPMDGWFHALFRYEHRANGHASDTSFGSHLFNLPITYRDEPQSYAGRPPGLTTRLFLRLGDMRRTDTFCHLIYPASGPWHATSTTILILHSGEGHEIGQREIAIPRDGSLLWLASEMFKPMEIRKAGQGWVLIRDTTCRLFGYHGLLRPDGRFSLDHLFGF